HRDQGRGHAGPSKGHRLLHGDGQDRDHRRTRAGLNSAKAHLRSVLGQQVRMKFTPDLEFEEDVGLEQVERVTELLKQISSSGDSETSGDGKAADE
ncbi:MAG TPA: ribosome-binding factor A, partial [Actinomycetota bacterium]|nr:ribosome-binding factor A [Actinomycetota bacterium]